MKRFIPPAGLLLVPFLFYWKLFAWDPAERKIFRGDFLNQHYVWKSYALARIRDGDFPLWNPHVLGGAPFHANPQSGLFYPPNYLLVLFLKEGRVDYLALEAFQLLHQSLAGLGMWLLLRSVGLGRGAAWGGALVATFSGFFTTPGHHALILTASWIPLVLYLVKRAVQTSGLRLLALTAASLTMLILAGHPQPAYYGLALGIAWALYCGGLRATARRFLPALLLGVALAAVQLLPTYELARDSTRGGAGYEYSSTFSFSPFFLSGMLLPRGQILLAGQEASAPLHIYVGIGALLLAVIGAVASDRSARWFFSALAAVSLLLAAGSDSFLFDLAYLALPGFDRFRIPFRLLGLYAVGMAGLAALGLEALSPASDDTKRKLRGVAWGSFGLFLVLAGWTGYLHTRLVASPGVLGPQEVERLVSGANWALLLLGLNIALLLACFSRGGRSWPAHAMLGLLAVDLGSFVKDRGLHPYETLVRTEERRVAHFLRAQGQRGRYVTETNLESYSMLHGTEFAGGQDSLVDGRYASVLALAGRSANALSLLNVRFLDRASPPSAIAWCGPRFKTPLPLLDLTPALSPLALEFLHKPEVTEVRVFWTPLGPGGSGFLSIDSKEFALTEGTPLEVRFEKPRSLRSLVFRLEKGSPGIRLQDLELDGQPIGSLTDFIGLGGNLYLNLRSLPRAFLLDSCKPVREEEAVDALSCWTPEEGAWLLACGKGRQEASRRPWISQLVEITRYEPEEVHLRVKASQAGYLVLADTFRPGWRAELNGEEVAVLRAQHALRSVAVPEGEHSVRFLYRPRSFYIGLGISLLGLLLLLTCFSRRDPEGLP